MKKIEEKVLDVVDENRDQFIEFLRDLIKIESVNPVFKDSETKEEKEAQEFLSQKLESLGFKTELWEPDVKRLEKYRGEPGFTEDREFDDRPNLFGKREGTGDGKSLILTGHIDVVGADPDEENWKYDPFSATIADDRIFGRGAVDMKGGIAAMIMAVESILDAGVNLAGDVSVGTVVDEETGSMGMLSFIERGFHKGADAGLMTEPTDLEPSLVSRGILWGRIKVRGKSGHIEIQQPHWSEDGAVDAVAKARKLLKGIDYINGEWKQLDKKNHQFLPRPCQVNVSMLEAGQHPSSYAEECTITVDVQYLPGETDETGLGGKVKKQVEKWLSRVADTDPWLREHPPEVEWFVDADTAEVDPCEPIVEITSDALGKLGLNSELSGTEAHTDMTFLTKRGVPTINLGPGETGVAHQTNENIKIADYMNAVKLFAMTILNWSGTTGRQDAA